jgi:hypothetical protein
MASYPQYQQSYVVAPAPAATQPYTQAQSYDPNAYAPVAVQPYQSAQPQHYSPGPQYIPAPYNRDELRTIFVTGFPPDIKDRELINMCRFMPGYEVRAHQLRRPEHMSPA